MDDSPRQTYPLRVAAWTLLAVTLLLVLRRLHLTVSPYLFAEDGVVFWYGNFSLGWHALLEPAAGYLHLIPRLWALLCGFADDALAPRLYFLCAVFTHQALVLGLFSPRLHLPGKPALALATVLVPHSTEVLANLTNIQWVASLGLILLSLSDPPRTGRGRLLEALLLVLLGLTGPFSILFAPLFVLRWRSYRELWTLASLVIILACASVQLMFLSRSPVPVAGQGTDWFALFSVFGYRTWWQFMGGFTIPIMSPGLPWCLLCLFGSLAFALWVFTREGSVHIQSALFCAWLAVLLSVAFKFWQAPAHLEGACNGDRYFYIPRVLVLWSLLLGMGTLRPAFRRVVATVLVLSCLMGYGAFIDEARTAPVWSTHVTGVRRDRDFSIPILPDWTIHHHAR